MLLAGTGFGIAGVKRINDAPVPWPGLVYRQLLAAWSNEVGCDLERQTTNLKDFPPPS